MTLPLRVAVLISGRGSNMAALLDAAAKPGYPAEIALVLSNRPDAAGLHHARTRGIEALCVDHRPHGRDRAAHEAAIHAELQERSIGLVCLAGYMRLLTPFFVNAWVGRMLNIHPSLLPAFPGLDTHARALAAGCKLHGCTVHLVTEIMDEGPILAQAAVPVLPSDDPGILAARVLRQEHLLYPLALRLMAEGLPGQSDPDASLSNPQISNAPPLLPTSATGT
ncbi:MAG: phosphoribosylglycinamide formyltransferase [Janthinobacterium lividum]